MDIPINDQDLETIVKALALGGDSRLYYKLKAIKEDLHSTPKEACGPGSLLSDETIKG